MDNSSLAPEVWQPENSNWNRGQYPIAHHANRSSTSIGQVPQRRPLPGIKDTFRTPQDNETAHAILSRNKEVKIESRSSFSRAFMTKSKRTKFDHKEIFKALSAVVTGHEVAGPGVVEVLRDSLLAEGGNVNFVPHKKSIVTFKKGSEERSRLLQTAAERGNVEVVKLLSRFSDEISLNQSFDIAIKRRDASLGGRNSIRDNQMIQILVTAGADGSNTITAAVCAGDETLLRLLLDGQPTQSILSEALPVSVTFRDTDTRWRLMHMLLEKGANVNHNGGESMFEATRLLDMTALDMLLGRRPQPHALGRAFTAALNQTDSRSRFEACHRLINAGATGIEVNRGLTVAVTAEYQSIDFLKLILLNASVDFEDGHALCLAVSNDYQEHLRLMLEKRPNEKTFDGAFAAAMRMRNPRDQLKYCRMLVGSGPPRDSCSKALIIAVKSQKEELGKVFLEKGASIDYEGGASIVAAVSSENIGILELLVKGVYQKPSHDSLVAGFEVALSLPSSQPKKAKLLRLLLDAGLKGPTLDMALVDVSKQGSEGLALCNLFLEYGASINAQGGEALDICTRSGNLELLQLQLQSPNRPTEEILSRIFQSSQQLDPKIRHLATELILQAKMPIDEQVAAALDSLVQEPQLDMQTIEVLLSNQVSVHYQNHRPLVTAAQLANDTLLIRLLAHSRDKSAASAVFDAMMRMDSFWDKKEAFSILTILLDHGAEGIPVNEALIKAVKDPQPSARYFEVKLLQHRVNIDYKSGEALQIATERGEAALVRIMLAMNPSPESVSMAFPFAFLANVGDARTLAIIDSFLELCPRELDPEFMHPIVPEPPVFLCIHHYPNSLSILESTLNAGFHIDQKMSSDTGSYTALFWALSAQGKHIGDNVIELLISRGANLHDHIEPLLNLAIEQGRHRIIQRLIDAKADVDLADENYVTPLIIATEKNDVTTMQALLQAGALPNDGSLHVAARMVNTDAINLLLKHGHDAIFPSIRLDGRPPLFELCLQGPTYLQQTHGTVQQKEKQLKKAILALIQGGALTCERLPQAGNRSLLHHALDSSNPHLITKALLESGAHREINHDFNLFTDGEYTYSPTKYVEKNLSRNDNTQNQSLIKLLRDFHAIDRFWKNSGAQPRDMCNPPPQVLAAEEARLAALERKRQDEEETRRRVEAEQREIDAIRRRLAIEAEEEQEQRERQARASKQRLAEDQQRHMAEIAKQNDRLRVREASDRHALRQAQSMSALRNNENETEYKRKMKLLAETKTLAESEAGLGWAYNQGLQAASGSGVNGRRPLSYSASKSNLSFAKRMQIEGPRITEVVEE